MLQPAATAQRRRAHLALPFAIVGAAAGWLSAAFLRNPLIGVIEGGHEALAALVAGVAGALVGLATSTRRRGHPDEEAAGRVRRPWLRLGALAVAGGAFTGAVVAVAENRSTAAMLVGAMNGGLSGVAFLPVCALTLSAAVRAERARLGSVVAASDRRAVWGILLTALAAAATVAALDWPFVGRPFFEHIATPFVGIGVLAVAELAVIGILLADARALGVVQRAARLPRRASTDLMEGVGARRLDLGLGDGAQVELAKAGAAAYRTRERAASVVRGDPNEARAALHSSLFRGAVGIGVIAVAAGAHVFAMTRAHELYSGDTAMVWSLGRAVAKLTLTR